MLVVFDILNIIDCSWENTVADPEGRVTRGQRILSFSSDGPILNSNLLFWPFFPNIYGFKKKKTPLDRRGGGVGSVVREPLDPFVSSFRNLLLYSWLI